jgi:hypothetical protein
MNMIGFSTTAPAAKDSQGDMNQSHLGDNSLPESGSLVDTWRVQARDYAYNSWL